MKTKRRHDLQTNILADWLGKQYELLKPYWVYIAAGVLALAAAILGGRFAWDYFASASRPEQESWNAFLAEMTTNRSPADPGADDNRRDKLLEIAKDHSGSLAAAWARQQAAESQLHAGLSQLYVVSDRATARALLNDAADNFDQVAKSADNDILKERALLGKAKASEGLAAVRADGASLAADQRKDLQAARDAYRELAKLAGDSLIGKQAKESLARLADEKGNLRADVTDFYSQLARYTPPPPQLPRMTVFDLPDVPDLTFPDDALKAIEQESGAATEGAGPPAETDPPPDDGTSDSATPGTTTPGTDSTPPAEKGDQGLS